MSDDYHDGAYSSYRPTSASLRSDAGNVPPGRFKEEVVKSSTQDAYAESDPITAYVVGTTTVTVSAAADWNSLGHSGIVETQRSSTDTGSQTLADDEDGAVYRRYWDGEGWTEWAASGGVGYNPNLALDAFSADDEVASYPDGLSVMQVSAEGWPEDEAGMLITERTGDTAKQTFVVQPPSTNEYTRHWIGGGDWTDWQGPPMLEEDAFDPFDLLSVYPTGNSYMAVTSGADWHTTGHAGLVITHKIDGDTGSQFFVDSFEDTLSFRAFYNTSWNDWVDYVRLVDFQDLVSRVEALENP